MTTELDRLNRQSSWDAHRRKLMADRVRLTNEAAARGEDPPFWIVDPPVAVPAHWERQDGQVSVQQITTQAPKRVVDEVVAGRNAVGQVVRGHEPPKLKTVERQFAEMEGRAQDERLRNIANRFSAVLRGKESA